MKDYGTQKKKKNSHLQPIDHGLFGIHGLTLLLDETLGQHPSVELLVYILVVNVLEDSDAVT